MRLSPPPHPVKHVDLVVHVSGRRSRASVFVGNRRAVDADRAIVLHTADFPTGDEVVSVADVIDVLIDAVTALREHPDALSG